MNPPKGAVTPGSLEMVTVAPSDDQTLPVTLTAYIRELLTGPHVMSSALAMGTHAKAVNIAVKALVTNNL
jgi:hypothetical protein